MSREKWERFVATTKSDMEKKETVHRIFYFHDGKAILWASRRLAALEKVAEKARELEDRIHKGITTGNTVLLTVRTEAVNQARYELRDALRALDGEP